MGCLPINNKSDCYHMWRNIHLFLQIERLQTNDYDCGLWVLASVAAILQGHNATGLTESEMLAFQCYL